MKRLSRHALALLSGPLLQTFVLADMRALGVVADTSLRGGLVLIGALLSGALLSASIIHEATEVEQ